MFIRHLRPLEAPCSKLRELRSLLDSYDPYQVWGDIDRT